MAGGHTARARGVAAAITRSRPACECDDIVMVRRSGDGAAAAAAARPGRAVLLLSVALVAAAPLAAARAAPRLLVEAASGGAVDEQKHDATDASSGLPVTVDTSWPALALEAPLEIALARARARAAQAGAKWSTGQQSGKLAEGTAAPPLRWRAVLVNSQQKTGTTAMEWLGAALLKHACEAANGEANVGSVDSAASEAIFSSAAGEDTAAATDRQAAVAATSADDAAPSGGGEAHARTSCVFSRSGANANNQRTFAATFYVGGVPAAVIEFEGWAYKHDLAISAKHKKLEALTGSRINQMARQCVEKLDVPTWSRRCIEEVGLEDAFEADLAEGRLLLPGDPSLGLSDSPVDGDAVDDEEDADILVTLRTSRDPIAIAASKVRTACFRRLARLDRWARAHAGSRLRCASPCVAALMLLSALTPRHSCCAPLSVALRRFARADGVS